jgi:hypothetical protein
MEFCNSQPNSNDKPRRALWQMDCLSICTVLGVGLESRELARLMDEHACPVLVERVDGNEALQLHIAHKTAHRDTPFSRAVVRLLDDKYREQVAWVARQSAESVAEVLESTTPAAVELPGILWGLLGDPGKDKQTVAEQLVHTYLRYALNACRPRPEATVANSDNGTGTDVLVDDAPDFAGLSVDALRRKVREQAATIERMLEYISRTRPVPAGVQEDES